MSPAPSFEIQARGLVKRFGDFTAVRDVTLEIPKGIIFGFLGPNGSGKSTTVKMLTGLLEPTAGEVEVAGRVPRPSDIESRRLIGVLPEGNALFHSLTLLEHLLLSGPLYGLTEEETERRAQQLLEALDLWDVRNTYADQASYGMAKKCSLAMAMLHNPRVLFLDEPFEGVDPASSRSIKDLLGLLASRGVTIFLTSHILEIAQQLVQSFAIIREGRIVCRETVEDAARAGRTIEDYYFEHIGRPELGEWKWLG
ncbi:MAG: ABC transporter ATP-binding protein [Acidobacteriota bacterium]|nr:ABC transporter ATP-binding protein [Acidobacteriota bacterium]